jgi:hypothetical protein
MNNHLIGICAIVSASTFCQTAIADDFDGSKPLLCATVEAHDCAANESCVDGTPHELGAPAFLRINVAKKEVAGPQRATAIKTVEKTDEQLLLNGTELGLGWTLAIDRETGTMSATMVDRDAAHVLFGSCTVP